VHAISGRVAIHCTSPDAVDAAVAAGADSIEHGWAVTDAHFAAMRESGIAWVPTLSPGGWHAACEFAAAMGFADETLAWMRMVLDAQPGTIARADRAGVTVLAGTDAGQGPHGVIVDQIQMLAACGMPITRAIGAASWTARRYLGLPSLEPGAPADLVIYDADPRCDLDVLRRAAVIILNGQPIDPDAARELLEQAFARACQIADPCWETWAAHGLGLRAGRCRRPNRCPQSPRRCHHAKPPATRRAPVVARLGVDRRR
jgi:imidazolonepropionase-like amidohydrolase